MLLLQYISLYASQFYGGGEAVMRAHFGLPSVCSDEPDADKWRKRSITVKFEMPYYTVSGIQVGSDPLSRADLSEAL
jgi:hypothetical protein